MRVIFFGTPDLAVPTLEMLVRRYTVVACVTRPDSIQGRKRVLTPPPVKIAALQHGIPVLQPHTLKAEKPDGAAFIDDVRRLQPDVAVVFAYGKIISKELLAIPRFGYVNIHPSLLPVLRGPSPIHYTILTGLPTAGVSIMLMDEGMDTGPILAQQVVDLVPDETAESLHDKMKYICSEILENVLVKYLEGACTPTPQDDSKATYSRIIHKDDGRIDWSMTPAHIERHIRAYTGWPGAFTVCSGKRIKVLHAHLDNNRLIIDRVQPEGKKPMSYTDFLRGYPQCVLPPIDDSTPSS